MRDRYSISATARTLVNRGREAFTIIELLVACAVLGLMLITVLAIVGQTSEVWRRSNARLEIFKGARNAFNNINRTLSQSTLNTYWDYDNPNSPAHYIRRSELHFVTGNTGALLGGPAQYSGQGIFFQAPINIGGAGYRGVEGLLNACGFYIEYGSNEDWLPPHVKDINPPTERYRLFQWIQDTDRLSVHTLSGTDWITPSLSDGAYPVAENVIALVIWPAQENGQVSSLNSYEYNTRSGVGIYPQPMSANQLPPLLQVAMVAIDEASAIRLGTNLKSTVEGVLEDLFESSPGQNFQSDLETLESRLREQNINYRVFYSSVPMREAKWSSN